MLHCVAQIHGGAGVSQDTVLAHLFAASRTLRIADGPDEVHLGTLAKLELEAAAGGSKQLKQRMLEGTRPKL
jgi:acyl-CoA dehydrogenase